MIVGRSPAIRAALEKAERFAPLRLPILLVGPTGSGKELFARHIHALSGRPGKLVSVNCGALPQDMRSRRGPPIFLGKILPEPVTFGSRTERGRKSLAGRRVGA